jgi:hypothetical protein
VPSHDLHDPFDIRWTASVHNLGDLLEVLGPKEPRGDRAELTRVLGVKVHEVMHVPARDKEDVAGSDTDLLVVKRPGQDTR